MVIEVSGSRRRGRIWQLNEGWELNESSIRRNPPVGYPIPFDLDSRPPNEMGNIRRNSPIGREIEMTNISRDRPVLPEYDSSDSPRDPQTSYPIPNRVDDLQGNEMSNNLRNSPTRPANELSHSSRNSPIREGNEMSYSRRSSPIPPAGSPSLHLWPPIESLIEHRNVIRTQTIVNLRKSTLRLEEDEENPGSHLLAFTFDTAMPGSIGIFYMAREGLNSSIVPLRSYLLSHLPIAFNRGFGQNFRQAPGTGLDLSPLENLGVVNDVNSPDRDLSLIIRLDTGQQDGWPGAPLPRDVPCHITQANIQKTGGQYRVSVLKQFVWVEGVRYEVNQIYGIGSGGDESEGLVCTICWSRPINILAFPCGHMSLCEICVKRLWSRTNRCPLCKTPMERLLKIEEVEVGY